MDKKRWYQSKTIWTSIVTGIVGVYEVVQPILAGHGINLPATNGAAMGTVLAILASLGVYFRKTTTSVIGK